MALNLHPVFLMSHFIRVCCTSDFLSSHNHPFITTLQPKPQKPYAAACPRRCSISRTTPAPPMYSPMSGTASSVCVKGSVEGVSTAAAMVAPTTTNRHWENICSELTMRSWPSMTWMTGTCTLGKVEGPGR